MGRVDLDKSPRVRQAAGVRHGLVHQKRPVEFQAAAMELGLAGRAGVRHEGVVEGQLTAELQARVRAHPRLVPAAEAVGHDPRRAHQRQEHRPAACEIASQSAVEDRQAVFAIAVVGPILRRELDRRGALDRPEGDFVHGAAGRDRRREEDLVADEFLVIQ